MYIYIERERKPLSANDEPLQGCLRCVWPSLGHEDLQIECIYKCMYVYIRFEVHIYTFTCKTFSIMTICKLNVYVYICINI